jgi:proteasome lid subunit RPN8/RPN11
VASPNVAADPESAFEVDPALLLRAHREAREGGHAILGWYHSHPDGVAEPSAVDAARAVEDGKLWLIVAGERLALYVAGGGAIRNRFTQGSLEIVHR